MKRTRMKFTHFTSEDDKQTLH